MKRNMLKIIALTTLVCAMCACSNVDNEWSTYYASLPFDTTPVERPTFPDCCVSVVDYGAVGDGITDNTEAINRAIADVSQRGGGRVVIPAGIWLTGAIEIKSNVELHAMRNALVIFDDDPNSYPIIDTSFEGLDTRRCTSPIWARNAENIALTGEGVWDGSGDSWRFVRREKVTDSQWEKLLSTEGCYVDNNKWYPSRESYEGHRICDSFNNPQGLTHDEEWEAIRHWLRPVMISFIECRNVLVEDVTLRNSPAWMLHPLMCENVIIRGVKIFNPWYSQNGDALDIESCHRVLVADCLLDAGDDGVCIKSGKDADGRRRAMACSHVVVRNTQVLHGHGGFVVGSEMSGGVHHVYVENCTFTGTDVGLRFKSTRGRGGVVEHIYIENINMCDIPTDAVTFNLYYNGKSVSEDKGGTADVEAMPVTEQTPAFRNIHIKNIKCRNAGRAFYFHGLPEMPVNKVTIEDVFITAQEGGYFAYTDSVTMHNVHVEAVAQPLYRFNHCHAVDTVTENK